MNHCTAESDPLDQFILTYDRDCKDDRSVIDAFLENKIFSKEDVADFEKVLSSLVQQTREERLSASPVSEENHLGRRLSDMDWEERRDQSISVLNFVRNKRTKKRRLSAASSKKPSVSHRHLKQLGMDIVEGSGNLIEIAAMLPCLAHPPEKNMPAYPSHLPNDFHSSRQWYLNSAPEGIGATEAWKCQNGQRNGPGVAVLDTGCSAHPDLKRNLCSGKEDCAGFDAVNGINPFNEQIAHGTAVAGFIAAVGNNKVGLAGVCWGCKIMCIKIFDAKQAYTSTIIVGIDYVLTKKHIVKITNHSYGSYGASRAEEFAYRELERAGILAVVAAGNHNCNVDRPGTIECYNPTTNRSRGPHRPASYNFDNMITVGASNRDSSKRSASNYGKTKVTLFAPGSDVEGLCNTKLQGCYTQLFSGTSNSAPMVSGAAALVWARDRTMTYKKVKDILIKSVRTVPALEPYCITGGILDVAAAMQLVTKGQNCSAPPVDLIPTPDKDDTVKFYSYNVFKEYLPSQLFSKQYLYELLVCKAYFGTLGRFLYELSIPYVD